MAVKQDNYELPDEALRLIAASPELAIPLLRQGAKAEFATPDVRRSDLISALRSIPGAANPGFTRYANSANGAALNFTPRAYRGANDPAVLKPSKYVAPDVVLPGAEPADPVVPWVDPWVNPWIDLVVDPEDPVVDPEDPDVDPEDPVDDPDIEDLPDPDPYTDDPDIIEDLPDPDPYVDDPDIIEDLPEPDPYVDDPIVEDLPDPDPYVDDPDVIEDLPEPDSYVDEPDVIEDLPEPDPYDPSPDIIEDLPDPDPYIDAPIDVSDWEVKPDLQDGSYWDSPDAPEPVGPTRGGGGDLDESFDAYLSGGSNGGDSSDSLDSYDFGNDFGDFDFGFGGGGSGGGGKYMEGYDMAAYATGGKVTPNRLSGPNPPGPDDGFAALKNGEFVLSKEAAEAIGYELLNRLNRSRP